MWIHRTRNGNERVKFRRHTLGLVPQSSFPQRQLGRYMATLPSVVDPGAPRTRSSTPPPPSPSLSPPPLRRHRRRHRCHRRRTAPESRNFRPTRNRSNTPSQSIAFPCQLCTGSYKALYIPETLANRPCIYLRIEIYRGCAGGRPTDRPAGRPAGTCRQDRRAPFLFLSDQEIPVLHSYVAPRRWAPFEFEYRYFGEQSGRERRAGVQITGISCRRHHRRVDETKTDAGELITLRARATQIKNRSPSILFSLHNVSITLQRRFVFWSADVLIDRALDSRIASCRCWHGRDGII